MVKKVPWDKFAPEFHLQPGEKVVRELRVAKLGINPHLFIILTVLTIGIFLFFWQYFRYPRTAKIIILTNTRVLSWETTLSSNPKILRQESYQISKISYYQHELVQAKPPCFGLCKCLMNDKPWTTFRVFFSRFPSEMPPSYNKSPALQPAIGTGFKVAKLVADAVQQGLVQNYIGMALNIIKALVKIAQYVLELLVRPEIILPGHYLEVDTSDEGSAEAITQFITEMLELYPYRNFLVKNKHEGAVIVDGNTDTPLWAKKEDPVTINPTYIQLGPGEVILDAIAEPPNITLWDWILAVATFSLYYFFVIKDLKHYKGALLVTDRRLISLFVHNEHGFKPDTKYIQISNSWFFNRFGDAAVCVIKPDNCIYKLFKLPSYGFLMEVGPGTIQLQPNPKNGKERILNFISHFFGYNHEQLVNGSTFPDRSGRFRDGFLLPGEEVLAATGKKTKKGCAFMCTRVCSCGIAPPDAKTDFVASTHRLGITLDASNWWEPEIITYDFYTSLANLSGFQLHDLEYSVPCRCMACKKVNYASVSIALRRDEIWTLPMFLPETKTSEATVQAFARVIANAQNSFENMEKGLAGTPAINRRHHDDDDDEHPRTSTNNGNNSNNSGGGGPPRSSQMKDNKDKKKDKQSVTVTDGADVEL